MSGCGYLICGKDATGTQDVERETDVTPQERIAALERDLADTRIGAAMMMLDLIEAMAETPEEREEIAKTFDAAAETANPATAHLAQLVAAVIRRG